MTDYIISNINETTQYPFSATAIEIIAFALEDNGLLTDTTIINNKPAQKLLDSFYTKRYNFQSATKLGQFLIKNNAITQEQLAFVLEKQQINQKPVGEIIAYEGFCKPEIIEEYLEKQTKTRFLYKKLEENISKRKTIVENLFEYVLC